MVFSSSLFLLYFLPVFLIAYILIDKSFKNLLILASSVFFYAWGAPNFIFILLFTTFIDFHVVKLIHNANKRFRSLYLALSICLNVGMLIYFKYTNFLLENFNLLLSSFGLKSLTWIEVVLPIGISFFTFETLTYSIDVYRRVHTPLPKFKDYLLYIILFPKLIAGPIVRFSEIADQVIDRSSNDNLENRVSGIFRFIIGLGKKVILANAMGEIADSVFNANVNALNSSDAWIGIIAYSFQIYFDFSGYSDMAIGLAKFMGFIFPENFNSPYISQNITEFWRRWHITLGRWMRDYLYIPLGGNRGSKSRMYFNLILVFLISGLWHGASWNFIIWGGFHGIFLILDRIFLVKSLNYLGKLPSILFTYFLVCIGWVFFRIESFDIAIEFISKLLNFKSGLNIISLDSEQTSLLVLAIFFSFISFFPQIENLHEYIFKRNLGGPKLLIVSSILLCVFIYSILKLSVSDFNPFIYFQF